MQNVNPGDDPVVSHLVIEDVNSRCKICMLPKKLPVKTECKTFRYRRHKPATPGVKGDDSWQKKLKKKSKKKL